VNKAKVLLVSYDDEVKQQSVGATKKRLLPKEEERQEERDIDAIFGYDQRTNKYAVRYAAYGSLNWLFDDQLVGTDSRWLKIAREHGMPVKTKNGKWRALTGALTRSQTRTVAADRLEETRGLIGVTVTAVPAKCAGELYCLANSVLNMVFEVCNDGQKADLGALEISETDLALKLQRSDEHWPIRMKQPTTTLTAGDFLVATTPAHTDGLRVFEDGSVHFFSCDQRISKFVLTQEHPYVQEILGRKSLRVIQLVKPDAAKDAKKAAKRKRARERKKLAKKLKMSD
jgi:hypothetical protein